MKIKNYEWNGFGFPIIFEELPAIKFQGELIPDVDFDQYAKTVIEYICTRQDKPFSGNQIKFIRNYWKMSLREFAKLLNVKHQSVMRWEDNKNAAARVDVNLEIIMRLIVLKKLKSNDNSIRLVVNKVDHIESFEAAGDYKKFLPIKVAL